MTDLYQLTTACGYWKSGTAGKEAACQSLDRSLISATILSNRRPYST